MPSVADVPDVAAALFTSQHRAVKLAGKRGLRAAPAGTGSVRRAFPFCRVPGLTIHKRERTCAATGALPALRIALLRHAAPALLRAGQ